MVEALLGPACRPRRCTGQRRRGRRSGSSWSPTRGSTGSILTGAFETADAVPRRSGATCRCSAETSGKNAIVVTPSADIDLAVQDVVRLRVRPRRPEVLGRLAGDPGRLGRDLGAASAAQLVDAVTSLTVALARRTPTSQMGPVIEPPHGKLLEALTTLAPGERWLVQPRQLDRPGGCGRRASRTAWRPGREFHLTEYFGPVLGLMTRRLPRSRRSSCRTQVDYGLTAGLYSLDPDEIATWCDRGRGRQPVRQPRHHRRDRAPPAVRRLEAVVGRGGHQGGRAELPRRPDGLGDPAFGRHGAEIGPAASSLLAAARRPGWMTST